MEDYPNEELLLSNKNDESVGVKKKRSFINSVLKWVLKITMSLIFTAWLAIVLMFPVESMESLVEKWTAATSSFLGFTGSVFVLFSGPVIILSILSMLYLLLNSDEESHGKGEAKRAKYRLWTFPFIVEGPFGVVLAAELIGIILVAVYVMWAAGVYDVPILIVLFVDPNLSTRQKWSWFFQYSARACGLAGIFCLSFMLIPIARGSPLLRLLNIPPDHAIRYHMWLGHLCMCLFTCHGFLYIIGWFISAQLPSQLIAWDATDEANLAGVINIFFGWSIWITSLPFVREKKFEVFYYTHHLYIIFIIFLAMHVGNFLFCIVAGAVFLFIVDRFLRFCQSRTTVDIISTRFFPCGVVELLIPRPQNLDHNALSCIFLKIKGISWLEWHPFSVTSSPLNGKNYLSVLIKACGNWTSKLKDYALDISVAQDLMNLHQSTKLTASVEGPYGYELSYYLRYEHLILVAGGIGISPFFAVLSDIMNRIKLNKTCLPTKIILVWAMKRSDELSLFSTIEMDSIPSVLLDELHLDILVFVTQGSEETPLENVVLDEPMVALACSASNGNSISTLASTGNKIWFAVYLISSTIGLIALIIIVNLLYIRPFEITSWWIQALILIGCMVASVLLFGGAVVGFWHKSEKKTLSKETNANGTLKSDELGTKKASFLEIFARSTTIQYGSRPDFKEIFGSIPKLWRCVDVGVIVCGPQTLLGSVAGECRSFNLRRKSEDPIFHFNSLSFSF